MPGPSDFSIAGTNLKLSGCSDPAVVVASDGAASNAVLALARPLAFATHPLSTGRRDRHERTHTIPIPNRADR